MISTMVLSPIGPVPSEFFRTVTHVTPCLFKKPAVPSVAKILNPHSCKPRAAWIPDSLSLSANEIKTVPDLGSGPKAAI